MNIEDHIISITDKNFNEVVFDSKGLIVVIFEKNFLGTAQIMKNILKELVSKQQFKFKLYKYDLEEGNVISNEFAIYNQTTILFFKNGKLLKKTGISSKPELEKILLEMMDN